MKTPRLQLILMHRTQVRKFAKRRWGQVAMTLGGSGTLLRASAGFRYRIRLMDLRRPRRLRSYFSTYPRAAREPPLAAAELARTAAPSGEANERALAPPRERRARLSFAGEIA
jgi:hypothetical protein